MGNIIGVILEGEGGGGGGGCGCGAVLFLIAGIAAFCSAWKKFGLAVALLIAFIIFVDVSLLVSGGLGACVIADIVIVLFYLCWTTLGFEAALLLCMLLYFFVWSLWLAFTKSLWFGIGAVFLAVLFFRVLGIYSSI